MSAHLILGLEQTITCSPKGKPLGNKQAQNGEGQDTLRFALQVPGVYG